MDAVNITCAIKIDIQYPFNNQSFFIVVFVLLTYQAVEHDSTLENTPSLSLQSLTEEEKVCQILF